MIGAYIIGIVVMLIGMAVQFNLKKKFKRYSEVQLASGLTGAQVAEKMLHDHGIYDVKIMSVEGQLTDHYNPLTKTVNLSEAVYQGHSSASAAIAAHEVGHAVQHATSYKWLQMRSQLVPVTQVASGIVPFVLMGGVLLINAFPQLLLLGIVLFSLVTLFTVVTLPVEVDASRRAIAWINNKKVVTPEESEGAKDALKWAAYTYFVAAIGSIATLLYYISIYSGRD